MSPILRSLAKRDAKAWRSLAAAFVLFGGVGLLLLFAAPLLGFDREASLKAWFAAAAAGPWGLPIAVAVFAGLAFLGVPQIALIAAAALAFGPGRGMAYSWIGTLVSALIGFGLGRGFGARALGAVSGPGLSRFIAMVGRNGFWASLLVRLAPSAPFILVNMAAGVTPMALSDFSLGTAIGIIPKIVLTALAGHSLFHLGGPGGPRQALVLGASLAAWVALGLAARAWLKRSPEEA